MRWRVLAGALVVVASRWLARARVPDDYDAIGFVRAVARFDLAALQPHPPGYPVYVALAKLLGSATAVSILAAGATAVGLYFCFREARAGLLAMALYAVAWMPLFLGGAALSETTAGAFLVGSFALARHGRWSLSGVSLALALGARPSWFPFALSWVILARARPRALAAFAGGLAAWGIPFVAVVGPASLWALSRAHVVGHFSEWGGTLVTRPAMGARLLSFVRDWFYDGLAPQPIALAVVAVALLVAARGLRPRATAVKTAAILIVPYASWALLAQNVLDQPRHLLPLVLITLIGLAVVLAERPRLAGVAVLAMLAASLPLAIARVRTPPAAAQMATWVQAHYDPAHVIVFGGRAVRFLPPHIPSIPRTWLSEVDVELERVNILPPDVLVTSEVEPDPVRARRLRPLQTFCRDPRIDRAQPCLGILRYAIIGGN